MHLLLAYQNGAESLILLQAPDQIPGNQAMSNKSQTIRLVYTSSATSDLNEEQLLELLKQSRSRNQKQNVTGMLVY